VASDSENSEEAVDLKKTSGAAGGEESKGINASLEAKSTGSSGEGSDSSCNSGSGLK
jgi:hypothetical protein